MPSCVTHASLPFPPPETLYDEGMLSIPPEKASIVLVTEPLKAGGLAVFTSGLLRGLLRAGLAPRVATSERPTANLGREEEALIEVFPGLFGALWRPFVYRRLAIWARDRKPALIHGLSAFCAPVCQKLSAALDIPYVLNVHHYQTSGALSVDGRCRAVLASSDAILENVINDARVPRDIVRVVPIGIEAPAQLSLAEAGSERDMLVVTISKLTPRKDVATFLRAARQVLDVRGGKCQFLIVGEGPEETRLRKLVRQLQLDKHVTFSHPGVPHAQILSDADVYVQTSRAEGFGISTLEAMAWGKPAVCTSVGGLISLIKDGQTGFLVPVNNPDAVASKIIDLLADAALRERIGRAAHAQVREHFTLEVMVEEIVQVYGEVLGLTASKTGIFRRPASSRVLKT